MNLTEALNRRAERGPRRRPDDVIAAVLTQHHPYASTEWSTGDAPASGVPLVPLVHHRSWRRPLLAGATAALLVGGAIAVVVAVQRTPIHDGPPTAGSPSATPTPPLDLTEQQRTDALDRCANGGEATSVVVDGRSTGILVGLTVGDTWRTCLYQHSSRGNGATVTTATAFSSGAPPTPLSLLPDTTPHWPITVIDAKAPEGDDVNGNEITWVWGRIDPSIATVTITTPTNRYTPTVHDGLFAASWRGNDGDRAVVHGFDAAGNEIAFADQLSCAALDAIETPTGRFTPMRPRVVIDGEYAGGGCVGGAHVPPGTSPDDFGN